MSARTRSLELQILIDLVEGAILARDFPVASIAVARVFDRLRQRAGDEVAITPERLPVCRHLAPVASAMAAQASPLPELASAFMALEPRLRWSRRRTSDPADTSFHDGHANATIVGPGGIEQRDDVWIGATVMAPDVLYPDHSHPPEEVYLAFTDGEWWNADMDWTEPGAGGLIHNPPAILHAMRSGAKPFLALWVLPID